MFMGAKIYWINLKTRNMNKGLQNLFDHIKLLAILRILQKIEFFSGIMNESDDFRNIIENEAKEVSEFRSQINNYINTIDKESAIPFLKPYMEGISESEYGAKTLGEILDIMKDKLVSVSLSNCDAFFEGEEYSELRIECKYLSLDDLNYQGNFLSAYFVRKASGHILGTYEMEVQLDGAADEGDTIFIGKFYPGDEPDEDSDNFTLIAFGLFKD